jgi:tRNA pseudouridine55 synthase
VDGTLNVNKPAGITSYKVVALIKRLCGERRVGHGGTLDPAASGVLPVCLGKATRTIEYFLELSKNYLAEIELGVTTDSYDASGKVISRNDFSKIDLSMLTQTFSTFSGDIWQKPPMFSALKHQGTPLYRLARAGVTIDRPRRPAKIYHIELISFESPLVMIEVDCGRGTYIRSLAHDLGEALGCGGTLKSLVRLKYGPFGIGDAITLPMLEDSLRNGLVEKYLHPIDFVLSYIPAITVDDEVASLLKTGHHLDIVAIRESQSGEPRLRVYSNSKQFLGVWRLDPESKLHLAEKVLS